MEPLTTGLFIFGLYKATEKIWEKGFDAAWEPVGEALKERFTRLAGRDKESQRRNAFVKAADVARNNTLRYAADPQQAQQILNALNSKRDRRGAEALAEEAAKLMLFSAAPDVPRLTTLCQERLRWDALWAGETPPPPQTVAVVLSDFLTNLREALLDQEPYHDLIQREMLRAMREVVAELRPVAYDNEATYRYQMAEMYRQLEFVGIPELKERQPITVEDIFIRLRAERESVEVLSQQMEDEAGDLIRFRPPGPIVIGGELVDVDEALLGTQRLVVLGDPGAGKTTLLKYLTVICAEGRAEAELGLKADGAGSPLPVFIPLREFAAECAGREQDYCLLDYLYTHAREHLMLNLPRGFFEDALDAGYCLVCLDGLDEVWAVGQRKTVTDAVKALAARFTRSRYVVTSRIVGYDEAPLDRRDFVHHTILPLEDDDIREFVRKWYAVREHDPVRRKRKADDLIATIEREPRIKALAANPLLLTIIVLVHRIEAELPHERVKLYDKCVIALVDTWEEVKGLTIAEKQRPFYRYRRRLLERLAYELHTQAEEPERLQTVKGGDLELLLTRFLMENRRLGLTDDPDGARDEARAFIRLARGRTGLLVERGEGVFGFPHLTFQEYLAACDVENRCIHRGVDAIWKEIKDRLHDPHWREVILLLLGSLNKYDEPPTMLVERILEVGEEDKFEPVLHRHLYLAARALADRVDVADDLHRAIVYQLLTIGREGVRVHVSTSTGIKAKGEGGDALAALGNLEGDPYAADGLLALARDPQMEAGERIDAALALGRLGCAGEAAEILLALARSLQVDTGVRRGATFALGRLGRAGEKVLDGLLALTRDEKVDDGMRSVAAGSLGQLGCTEEAGKVLLTLACDPQVDIWVRSSAASTLGGLSHLAVLDGLLALARDPQVADSVRIEAAWSLGQLGCVEEAGEVLLALVRDSKADIEMRSTAVWCLGGLGHPKEAVLDDLLALACDEKVDAGVRSDAAMALGQLGWAEKAEEILLALARDPQVRDGVRRDAAFALGQLDRTEEAAEVLLALVRDSQVEAEVRGQAAWALGELGCAEEAGEVLLVLARAPQVEAEVHSAAVYALGQLDRAEKKVLDSLLALACDEKVEPMVRRAAVSALGQLGCAEARVLDGLLALARDPQVGDLARSEAYESLNRLVGGAVEPLKP